MYTIRDIFKVPLYIFGEINVLHFNRDDISKWVCKWDHTTLIDLIGGISTY